MAEDVRDDESIYPGTINKDQLKAQLGNCTDRTIRRYECAGMPFIAVGNLRRYKIDAVRAWFFSHERKPQQPQRGRPRKLAA